MSNTVTIRCTKDTYKTIASYAKEVGLDDVDEAADRLAAAGENRRQNLLDYAKTHPRKPKGKGKAKVAKAKPAKAKAEPKAKKSAAKPKTKAAKTVKAKAEAHADAERQIDFLVEHQHEVVEAVEVAKLVEEVKAKAKPDPVVTVTYLPVTVGDSILDCDPRRRVVKKVIKFVDDDYVQVQGTSGPATNIPRSKIHKEPARKKGYALVPPTFTDAAPSNAAVA